MTVRVRNLEKITKELLIVIGAWEESNGPFLFDVCFSCTDFTNLISKN